MSRGLKRRELLRLASALPALSLPFFARADEPIATRAIPSTGERIPIVGLGTSGAFEVEPTEAARAPLAEVLRLQLELPNSLIDTAPIYVGAEAALGALLTASRARQRAFIATKISAVAGEGAKAQFARSLNLLRSDHVDLLQVHSLVDWRANLAWLRELKAQGKVRYIGVTHYQDYAHEELAEVIRSEPLDFVQINYSVASRNAEKAVLPACADRGVAVIINRAFEDGALFAKVKGKALPEWAAEIGCASWGQLMLKFVLSHPAVTATIPSTNKAAYLRDNLGAGRGRLPDSAERERIASLFA